MLEKETEDETAKQPEAKVEKDAFYKITEVMAGINKSIELLMKRVDQIDGKNVKVEAIEDLKAIHNKDVDKPAKHDGTQWLSWSADFTAFLERRDRRWGKLLKAIEKHSIDPLAAQTKQLIAIEAGINKGTLVEDFTGQLYECLKSYSSGDSLSRLVSGGKANSWETWRIMSDQGKSRRKLEMHEEYKRLMNPSPSPLETILKNIAQWERDLAAYTAANDDDMGISEDMKKLILENMCPEALQEHLTDKLEQGMISSYDQYKQAISTYVYRKTRKGKAAGKKLQSLQAEETHAEEENLQCGQCGTEDQEWDAKVMALMKQAEEINGQLNALVKGKFDKGKAGGKGAGGKANAGGPAPMQVDHSQKDCYICGEIGHIAVNCPGKGKAGGKAGRGAGGPKGGAGFKGGGKGGKDGKGGKAGKGGNKGGWPPSLQTWRTWYPGPSPAQWTEWWKQGSNDQFKSRTNLFEQPHRLSQLQQNQQQEQWWDDSWAQPAPSQPSSQQVIQSLFASGNMFKMVEKGPKAKTCCPQREEVPMKNRFSELAGDADEEAGKRRRPRPMETVPIAEFIKPPSQNQVRKRKAKTAQAKVTQSNEEVEQQLEDEDKRGSSPDIKAADTKTPKFRILNPPFHPKRGGVQGGMSLPADEAQSAETSPPVSLLDQLLNFTRANHGDTIAKPGLKVLRQNQPTAKLSPLTGKERPRAPNGWEVISAVVDSGATITAIHPEDGQDYKVEESEASRNGVMYQVANFEEIPNLGEKKLAVLTAEGTLRGFKSQVAEVSSPLESVRQLLGSKHCVLFGLGEDEEEHLIINKITGEANRLRDDGINYMHDMLVVPPDKVKEVQDAINSGASPFGRPGNGR